MPILEIMIIVHRAKLADRQAKKVLVGLFFMRPSHRKVRFNQYLAQLFVIPAIFIGSAGWWMGALFVFYMMHGVGSGIGAHRYFTHKSFSAPNWARVFMAYCFTIASTGSVIGYVLIHLKHHRTPDSDGDPHDPRRMGPLKTWFGILDKKFLTVDPRAYMRLRQDKTLVLMHDYYFLFIFSYLLVVSVFWGLRGAVFLYFVPVAMQFHANSALIVLCHSKNFGYRNYETQDQSKNLNIIFKFFLLGEELHNNHHFRPGSATVNTGRMWREFDPLFYVIKYLLSHRGDMRVISQK